MTVKDMLYEGKSKQVYLTDDPGKILVRYKDTITAYDNIKQATIRGKGILNCSISAGIFSYLDRNGVGTHYLESVSPTDQICTRVSLYPVEIIVRNVAAGTMAKRLGIAEGTSFRDTVIELRYKDSFLGHPFINDCHALALGIASKEDLSEIHSTCLKVNELLKQLFASIGITLVDYKIELGRTSDGRLLVADEISPDTCRLWDSETGEILDKDRFRKDLGHVYASYKEVERRLRDIH